MQLLPNIETLQSLNCRHEKYVTQYRAMFVVNCRIKKEGVLEPGNKRKRNRRASASATDTFKNVCCSVCSTDVGVIDEDEVYHFFNVIPSEAWLVLLFEFYQKSLLYKYMHFISQYDINEHILSIWTIKTKWIGIVYNYTYHTISNYQPKRPMFITKRKSNINLTNTELAILSMLVWRRLFGSILKYNR